ncbi:MAG: hydrogenase formation protein HypD [Nitrospira sp.]|nr:hydrogenase formation protein HypD [bacterium]MBL7048008.1 hydrogenase formation protein HypD [Nitrospira sp.]
MKSSEQLIKIIHSLVPAEKKIKIMNVCGSHEHTIAFSGIRSILPANLEIIPGPGCPVCVCSESDIINAINLSNNPDVILVTYGDMLRVPTRQGSIRADGTSYKMITSPMEAISIAKKNPEKSVVFFSIGFETTTAPTAAILQMGLPDNLFILSSHKLTPVIMELLVKDTTIAIDGFIAPGHVSAIVGANAWKVFPEKYGIPIVVAGFEAENLLMGLIEILSQLRDGLARAGNVYKQVVRPEGNAHAQGIINKFFKVADINWRGIGHVPESGLQLRDEYARHNANVEFNLQPIKEEKIPGCICGNIILGKAYPSACGLFKTQCSPRTPQGPCMVSMEGACNIWYRTSSE